jgi:plasmid stabilization system protein ParE
VSAVRFGLRALRDAERVDAWWRMNRPAAPDLFSDELRQAIALLGSTPSIGTRYDAPTRLPTLRVLLPESQIHMYYRIESQGDAVTIMALWGARRGRGPALR